MRVGGGTAFDDSPTEQSERVEEVCRRPGVELVDLLLDRRQKYDETIVLGKVLMPRTTPAMARLAPVPPLLLRKFF